MYYAGCSLYYVALFFVQPEYLLPTLLFCTVISNLDGFNINKVLIAIAHVSGKTIKHEQINGIFAKKKFQQT